MIAVGHRFSSGAVTLGVIPADKDSVIVLARVREGEYVIGRVHVSQLPHPEEWHNGDYFRSVEGAVKRWLERTGPWSGDDLLSATRHMTALIESIEKALTHEPGTLGEFLHERRIPGVPCGHEGT